MLEAKKCGPNGSMLWIILPTIEQVCKSFTKEVLHSQKSGKDWKKSLHYEYRQS
tara:strand:- start:410721 stop:410882 length:162 start_codon:yes stop_codon:yes gene_type:complete